MGVRRKEESFSAKDIGSHEVLGDEEKARAAVDPMYRLEVAPQTEQTTVKGQKRALAEVVRVQDRHKDDYGWSQKLRKKFRTDKKEFKRVDQESSAKGFGFRLLAPSKEDGRLAKKVAFAGQSASQVMELQKLRLKSQSIFGDAVGSAKHRQAISLVVRWETCTPVAR